MAGGTGVPETEGSQPVGVDVLRGALQLGKGGDGPPALVGPVVVDLEQECLVGLDDQWAIGHMPLSLRRANRSAQSSPLGEDRLDLGEDQVCPRRVTRRRRPGTGCGLIRARASGTPLSLHLLHETPPHTRRPVVVVGLPSSGPIEPLEHYEAVSSM